MTCKDCLYYPACDQSYETLDDMELACNGFENKADFKRVKHGVWIKPSGGLKIFEDRYVICSECNVMLPVIHELDKYYYCPKCGTEMGERSGA